MKNALLQNAPSLEVLGSNYPPPPLHLLVARVVGGLQFFVIGVALFGERLFAGGPVPDLVQGVLQNKMNACAVAWFVGNMVYQNLMATGAFEVCEHNSVVPRPTHLTSVASRLLRQVFYDGKLVFSKLQSGTRPDLGFIVTEVLRRRSANTNF